MWSSDQKHMQEDHHLLISRNKNITRKYKSLPWIFINQICINQSHIAYSYSNSIGLSSVCFLFEELGGNYKTKDSRNILSASLRVSKPVFYWQNFISQKWDLSSGKMRITNSSSWLFLCMWKNYIANERLLFACSSSVRRDMFVVSDFKSKNVYREQMYHLRILLANFKWPCARFCYH